MCGICGWLDLAGTDQAGREAVRRMTGAQVHRGPDDEGFWSGGPVHLGFRRLSVIDLVTGQQPVRLEDDRAVLVMNGEIYNFRELRSTLEDRQRFRSRGDAEVLLRLYAERGIDAVRELDGMFAFALWDRVSRTLHLGRDRYGIKPLFYVEDENRLAFASEMNALLAAGLPDDTSLDPEELGLYLAQGYVSPRGTLFRHARSVPPATVLSWGPDGRRTLAYWSPPAEPQRGWTFEKAVDAVAQDLDAAVRRQRVSDVPVGVFLSGGVDSGTLAALFSRQVTGPLHTFSVGFDDPEAVSEAAAARETAAALGTTHHAITMDSARVLGDLERIFASLDGPQGDATAIPTWYVSRLAREHVTVALAGEGADEIFGGYNRQRHDALVDRLGPFARLVPWMRRLTGRRPSSALVQRMKMPRGLDRLLDWSRVVDDPELARALGEAYVAGKAFEARLAPERERFARRAANDPLAARMEADLLGFLPCDLLPKVDRMSMAHSLEVRVPFLDNALVDRVLALPGSIRMHGRTLKPLLRAAASRILPPPLASRPKQGFDVPISAWLRGPLREPMRELLLDSRATQRGWFRPDVVRAWIEAHESGREDRGAVLWHLVALEGWWRGRGRPATRAA